MGRLRVADNAVDPDETGTRILVFAAMGAMFILALAIPQAFAADALLFARSACR
jgi:low temperature requirement protein LtrA